MFDPDWDFCPDIDPLFPALDGDVLFTFDSSRQKFIKHTYSATTGWDNYPIIGADEAFWLLTKTPRTFDF